MASKHGSSSPSSSYASSQSSSKPLNASSTMRSRSCDFSLAAKVLTLSLSKSLAEIIFGSSRYSGSRDDEMYERIKNTLGGILTAGCLITLSQLSPTSPTLAEGPYGHRTILYARSPFTMCQYPQSFSDRCLSQMNTTFGSLVGKT